MRENGERITNSRRITGYFGYYFPAAFIDDDAVFRAGINDCISISKIYVHDVCLTQYEY